MLNVNEKSITLHLFNLLIYHGSCLTGLSYIPRGFKLVIKHSTVITVAVFASFLTLSWVINELLALISFLKVY